MDGTGDGLGAHLLEVLDAVVSRLIPSDENGPGAAEAGVTRYITRALDGDYREHRPAYAQGLSALDAFARSAYRRSFVALGPEQQDAVLTELEQGRVDGASLPPNGFFELVRRHALEGMFGDPRWGGNAGQIGWRLLGYAGPRHVWSEEDQQIVDIGHAT